MFGFRSLINRWFPSEANPPETRSPKTFLLCFDGTWVGALHSRATVVGELGRLISQSENVHEISIEGVGTGLGLTDQVFGGIGGWGTLRNVIKAYGQLAKHYKEGDRIILTGFSRGAWAARYLAHVINLVGLPKTCDEALKDRLYEVFDGKIPLDSVINDLREEYHWRYNVRINALCCYDTVGSLGVPLNGILAPFRPLFENKTMSRVVSNVASNVDHAFHAIALHETRAPYSPTLMCGKNVHQVFFPGVHGDIGFLEDCEGRSHAPFAWMIQQLHQHLHISFDEGRLKERFPRYAYEKRPLPSINVQGARNTSWTLSKASWFGGKIRCYNSGVLAIIGKKKRSLACARRSDFDTESASQEALAASSNFRIHVGARMRFVTGDRNAVPKYRPVEAVDGRLVWVLKTPNETRSHGLTRFWRRVRRRAEAQRASSAKREAVGFPRSDSTFSSVSERNAMEESIEEEPVGDLEAQLLGLAH